MDDETDAGASWHEPFPDLQTRVIPGFRAGVVVELNSTDEIRSDGSLRTLATQAKIRLPDARLTARVWFKEQDNHRVVSSVLIAPSSDHLPPGGIDWRAVRAVKIGDVQREVDYLIAQEDGRGRLSSTQMKGLRTRPGRKGREDIDYARVAAAYVGHLSSRTPIADLARELHLSPSAARDTLAKARSRGLLTRVGQGRAGGELTPRAVKLLEEDGWYGQY